MGQCVSRKADAVIAASGYSPSYRIMEKPAKNKSSKKNTPHTWGTAISFGFRRRNASGIPVPVMNNPTETAVLHPRSKSAGPEHNRRHDEEGNHARVINTSSSGRSTPRLAPPKKEAAGLTVRTNRFGFRQPQPKYTDKVSDVSSGQNFGHYNEDKPTYGTVSSSRLRASPVMIPAFNPEAVRRTNVLESVGKYTESVGKYVLHSSHLPQPQYAVRVTDTNSKIAKTAVNQSRKVATPPRLAGSKEGSGTEDSGIGSQHGFSEDYSSGGGSGRARRDGYGRARNLRMVVNGKSFDVRDVDDDSTVTEISVIPLPKTFASPNLNTGLVRERTTQYQRILNKDNRYNDSTTSMSTTSSEGYDEGLGEEKGYKDRSRSEKIPSIKSDFSPMSSDDPEYGHGEAMADEYSLSSSEEGRQSMSVSGQFLKISNGAMPKSALRSVLLTIEDPKFAAAAATTTTLIDDETSPVDSLFDSPTASITQSEGKVSKKERVVEKNAADDDSPGTPTNASNSLSLSEGREYFDDEIADQPGLVFDDTVKGGNENQSGISQSHTDNTLVESSPKICQMQQRKSVENSPMHGRKLPRTRSIDTLSSCESIASDDLMMDYERSDASSCGGDVTYRLNSTTNLHDVNGSVNSLEAQEEAMREWISMMGVNETDFNSTNNNMTMNRVLNNNNPTTESGISSSRTSALLKSRSGADSPKSTDSSRSRQIFSPLRTPRNAQSPSIDSGDEGSLRMERGTYQYMFQDIVSIKTMLLKLKRVLQESEENGLTRSESLNPFDNSVKNGLFYNLNEGGDTIDTGTSPGNGSVVDELSDLRRQVVFLQGQLEDKDRTIQSLQSQIVKYQDQSTSESQSSAHSTHGNHVETKDTCNAATQTEKLRPVSAGPSLLQSHPQEGNMGPLVSWSESWNHQKPSASEELHSSKSIHKTNPRLQQSLSQQDAQISQESSFKRIGNCREAAIKSLESPVKFDSPVKSAIPTPRRLATPTLIPRAARTVSATGRSYNA